MRRRLLTSLCPLVLALAVLGCGSSSPAHPVPSLDAGSDAGDGSPASDAGDGSPAFSLGLTPPAVDCAPYTAAPACALRVKTGAAPAGADGLSWATAFGNVQDALDRATCGCEVWIAGGTYAPTRSLDAPGDAADPRDVAFVLWPGAHVYGGFAGNEAAREARQPGGAATVLSGDLGAAGDATDNAYHVVVGADGAELDGLTIRGGEADGLGAGQGVGAGLFAFGASMTLRNLTITDNDADSGAGIYSDDRSYVHLTGCTLARNTANDGGALVVLGAAAVVESSVFADNVGVFSGPAITDFADALTVSDSRFLRNRGDSGGALTVSAGRATFDRCWFEGNQAGSFGGALLVRFGSSARLSSSVLVANGSVGFGGAVAVWTASVELEATTVVDDTAAFGGAFLVKDASTFTLKDSVVWGSPDDAGLALDFDGAASTTDLETCDLPPDLAGQASFQRDPRLANVPLATRFAVQAGAVDSVPVTGAAQIFVVGDRLELGDDGVERRATAVAGDTLSFAPPLAAPAPRFLRVDRWAEDAPSLALDLTPTASSPLVDAASAAAPALDVFGHARAGAPDVGAIELSP